MHQGGARRPKKRQETAKSPFGDGEQKIGGGGRKEKP